MQSNLPYEFLNSNYNLIQKQPSCEKCAALKNAVVKKDVKSKVAAKKWLW